MQNYPYAGTWPFGDEYKKDYDTDKSAKDKLFIKSERNAQNNNSGTTGYIKYDDDEYGLQIIVKICTKESLFHKKKCDTIRIDYSRVGQHGVGQHGTYDKITW